MSSCNDSMADDISLQRKMKTGIPAPIQGHKETNPSEEVVSI